VSAADPEAVLRATVDAVAGQLGDRFLAGFAIGSLAHGGFAPAVSDVDAAIVVADPTTATDGPVMTAVADGIRARGGLAARLSLFWSTPALLASGRPGGRMPALDRLDLATHGRLLAGTFDRSSVHRPTTDELVLDAVRFALDKLAGDDAVAELRDPAGLVARGARHLTKRVLFPVRFTYTAATGAIGRNEDAVAWYVEARRPGAELVAAAAAWRSGPVDRVEAEPLLGASIIALYDDFLAAHVALMEQRGETDLATALRDWRRRLGR
jgi:hypothetical protein